MILAALIIAPFTAGVAVMIKEMVKAPVAYQDENGFHIVAKSAGSRRMAQAHARLRKARHQTASGSGVGSFQSMVAH